MDAIAHRHVANSSLVLVLAQAYASKEVRWACIEPYHLDGLSIGLAIRLVVSLLSLRCPSGTWLLGPVDPIACIAATACVASLLAIA